jgi:hypothetical protein
MKAVKKLLSGSANMVLVMPLLRMVIIVAKYTVTRACGHEETVVLFGKTKDRDWRLENVEPQKLCSECYAKQLAEQREKENAEAAEAAKEMNLPELTGSEKQIAWAETIRQKMLVSIDEFIFKSVKAEMRNDPQLQAAVQCIRNKAESRWWIDHRYINMPYEFRQLLEEAAKEAKEERMQAPAEVIADAKIEATIRPESPVTETVAEIRALENSIEIVFPEKRDDFRQLVKQELKVKWDSGKWVRKLHPQNGTPGDRATEAGHRLLAAGFIVRLYDEDIRRRAIAGEYDPECTRWVQARTGGKYKDWFYISWDRQDDFYKAARRLPGSRYDSPGVAVPPEQFAEVLDFAEMYGFKVSTVAMSIAEAARQAKDAALVAQVDAPAVRVVMVARDKPPLLNVPVDVSIADEFREEV